MKKETLQKLLKIRDALTSQEQRDDMADVIFELIEAQKVESHTHYHYSGWYSTPNTWSVPSVWQVGMGSSIGDNYTYGNPT